MASTKSNKPSESVICLRKRIFFAVTQILLFSGLRGASGFTIQNYIQQSSPTTRRFNRVLTLSSEKTNNKDLSQYKTLTMDSKLQEQIQQMRKQKAFKDLPEDAIEIIPRDQQSENENVVPINSILLQAKSEKELETILVIVSEGDKIDLAKVKSHWKSKQSSVESIELAPSDELERLVGYTPGNIPPLGHIVGTRSKVIPTIIDESLIQDTARRRLLGGGGHESLQCLVRLTALVGMDHVDIANVSLENEQDDTDNEAPIPNLPPPRVISLPPWGSTTRPKPLFPVETPDMTQAKVLLNENSDTQQIPPKDTIWVTLVGKIFGVRRMSKRLVFCDLVPPGCELPEKGDDKAALAVDSNAFSVPKEWRSATDGEDISVQLIGGNTFCQAMGEVQGQAALRGLRAGQYVLVQAKINAFNSKDSLESWVNDRRLDLALVSYQILHDTPIAASTQGSPVQATPPVSRSTPKKPYLQWRDVFHSVDQSSDSSEYITVVDDDASIQIFAAEVSKLLGALSSEDGIPDDGSDINGASLLDDQSGSSSTSASHTDNYAFIGLDCEWKPNFYLNNPQETQPVLVFQVNIRQHVYLLDMQTIIRPFLATSETMTPIENHVNSALQLLFKSRRLIKVGFQLMQDLQKMAASYPHLSAFQQIHSVVETATIAKKLMHEKKQKNVRVITSSLTRMTEHFLNRSVNKEQQVSDWSQRPLSPEQMDYAAMDAAITPALMRQFMEELGLSLFPPKPELGRWKGDVSYRKMITSWKFLFLQPDTDARVIKKLKAKPILRNNPVHILAQSWVTGESTPSLPSVPVSDKDGPYTDVFGILRMPSTMVRIRPKDLQGGQFFFESLVGQRTGKSKKKCLQTLLTKAVEEDPRMLPEGSRLEYPQRSGYVEFEDGVVLFVNMPEKTSSNSGQPRSYPNEWLEDGKVLTWFVRDYEWQGGSTSLAKKVQDPNAAVVLFVRVTSKNYFLCCGRCRVDESESTTDIVSKANQEKWYLIQLNLKLLDWEKLSKTEDFRSLVM